MNARPALLVTSWIMAGIGLLLLVSGGVMVLVFGSRGDVQSDVHRFSTPTRAMVSEVAQLGSLGDLDEGGLVGRPSVELRATTLDAARPVFIGIAPAGAVEGYLAGAQIDVVEDLQLSPFDLRTVRQDGTAVPPPPADAGIWVASATSTGTTAALTWTVEGGDYRFVVMSADAAPGVDVDAQLGLQIPGMRGIGQLLLWTGLGFAVVGGFGIIALTVGRRSVTAVER